MHPIPRILGICFVFCIAAFGWAVLAGVTKSRTDDTQLQLDGRVADLWGSAQTQPAPTFVAAWYEPVVTEVQTPKGLEKRTDMQVRTAPVDPVQTRAEARIHLDTRRKGLLWFPLYDVDFDGAWTLTVHAPAQSLTIDLPFPDAHGVYAGFTFVVDGVDHSAEVTQTPQGARYTLDVHDGQVVKFQTHYASRGQGTWRYQPSAGVGNLSDFQLVLHTDFDAIDFPADSLSPSAKSREGDGWLLTWAFPRVVTGYGMGMVMPEPVQPGELVTEITMSAPLSLGFFFLWIFALGLLRGIEVHPINYLFLAGAFFAFDLLFSYTADRLPVEQAFALASFTSIVLVVSYLRLVVGTRFAFVEAGLAQLLYQVGFALAHFWDGFTGLTITVLAIVTLFLLMQMTGRVKWSEVLTTRPAPPKPA